MKFSDEEIDKAFTLIWITVGFLIIVAWGSNSMDFQKRCELTCGNAQAITPLVDLGEQCFCSEGHGKWRREEIGKN